MPKSIARTIWVSTDLRMSKSFGPRKNGMFIGPVVETLYDTNERSVTPVSVASGSGVGNVTG